MKNSNARRQAKKITAHTVTYICSAVIAVFFVFPLIWMIVTSTKTELQYANDLGSFNTFLPYLKDLSTFFDNYKSVLTQYDIWKYALNSFGYALAVVAGNILVNALAGYVMAKFTFPGKGFMSFIIMFLLIVPVETTIIPLYSIVHNLGMSGTVFAVILPPLVSVFNIFLFQQFFTNISKEYIEAAQLDGASEWSILLRIMLPLVRNVFFTVMLLQGITFWNDYQVPMLYLPSHLPLSYGLYYIANAGKNEMYYVSPRMAGTVVVILPILIVFLIFKDKLMGNISMGGIKG